MAHRIKPIIAVVLTAALLIYCAFAVVYDVSATTDGIAAIKVQQYQAQVKQWGARILPITASLQAGDYDTATKDVDTLRNDIAATTPPLQYVEFHQHYSNAVAMLKATITFWQYGKTAEGIKTLEMANNELDKANAILLQLKAQEQV